MAQNSASSNDKSKTVLVTGATDGLGRATAVLLAGHGFRVFAGGRNPERLAALNHLASERKLPLEALPLDVTDEGSVERAVAEIERRAGPVEILVNNAGIAIAAPMEEITISDLRKQLETNFFAAVRITQRVLPEMRRRRSGRIINMSSIAGKVTTPLFGPYSSSKHALEAVSDALRLELFPFGIHVVLIEPGFIPTSMDRTASELSSVYAQGAERSPYKLIFRNFLKTWEATKQGAKETPEDCARLILRAIEETPPRARYVITRRAKMMVALQRLLTDRAFDGVIKKALNLDEVRDAIARDSKT